MKAQYISFEGIDGSGKTKQVELLKNYLESKGKKVLVTREFGSHHNEACVRIRDFALNSSYKLDELSGQFMFAACSTQHSERVITPNLDKVDYILSDRSIESNIAYCTALGIGKEFAETLFYLDKRRVHPDVVLFLDVDPEVSWSRVSKRSKETFTGGGEDRIEAHGIALQHRVREAYYSRAQKNNKYVIIDSHKDVEQTHLEILRKLGLDGQHKEQEGS